MPNTNRPRMVIATAPGKIILTGEHFVVLGSSALSMAINLHSTVHAQRNIESGGVDVEATIPVDSIHERELNLIRPESLLGPLRLAAETAIKNVNGRKGGYGAHVDVECEIPLGAGLGSSAATSVAIIAAVAASQGRRLSKEEIFRLAYVPERTVHNKPSGIDQATSTYGGIIEYARGGKVEKIRIHDQPCLVICDTGVHRSTGRLVGGVVARSKRQREAQDYRERVREVTMITRSARRALDRGSIEELGELMNRNQALLREIGVSHPRLDRLIRIAREQGALGAKLTGAGGGGCLIALCRDEASKKNVTRALEKKGGLVYKTELSRQGVTVTV